MCWSATADLVGGTGIAAIGVACVVQASRVRDLPLAAHCRCFSAPTRSSSPPSGAPAAVPAWDRGLGDHRAAPAAGVVPLGVLLAAQPRARRRLVIPVAAGLATVAVLAYCLAARGVTADIRGHTLGYVLDLPHSPLIITGYLLATVGSLLLAGDPVLRLLGLLAATGAVACAVLWRLEFVSTWCALAAVASVVVLGWVRRPAGRVPG